MPSGLLAPSHEVDLHWSYIGSHVQILRQVWADKTIQPRVKTFAWRLLRLALGTTSTIHRIIPNINETCLRCGGVDNEVHLFLSAVMPRTVWFAFVIGIRAHALPSSGHGLHMQIMTILQQGPS